MFNTTRIERKKSKIIQEQMLCNAQYYSIQKLKNFTEAQDSPLL